MDCTAALGMRPSLTLHVNFLSSILHQNLIFAYVFAERLYSPRINHLQSKADFVFLLSCVLFARKRSKSFSQNADSRTVVLLIQNAAIVTARIRKTIDRAEFALKFCSRINYLRIKMVPIIPFCSCSSTMNGWFDVRHVF